MKLLSHRIATLVSLVISSNATSAAVMSYENTERFTLADGGFALSNFDVSGISGTVTKVSVEFTLWSSSTLFNLDVKLRDPNFDEALIFSDIDYFGSFGNTRFIIDEDAASLFPRTISSPSGATFTGKPTDYDYTFDDDPGVFGGPGSGTLSSYAGKDPTGTWRVVFSDDLDQTSGDFTMQIERVRLNIEYTPVPEPSVLTLGCLSAIGLALRRKRG